MKNIVEINKIIAESKNRSKIKPLKVSPIYLQQGDVFRTSGYQEYTYQGLANQYGNVFLANVLDSEGNEKQLKLRIDCTYTIINDAIKKV
jgi:hypothetical protein